MKKILHWCSKDKQHNSGNKQCSSPNQSLLQQFNNWFNLETQNICESCSKKQVQHIALLPCILIIQLNEFMQCFSLRCLVPCKSPTIYHELGSAKKTRISVTGPEIKEMKHVAGSFCSFSLLHFNYTLFHVSFTFTNFEQTACCLVKNHLLQFERQKVLTYFLFSLDFFI